GKKRRNKEKPITFSYIASFATDYGTLNCCTIGHSLIRINTLVWFFAIKEFFQQLLDHGNSSTASNKHNLMDIAFLKASIFQSHFHWPHSLLKQVHVQLLKSSPC
ncbi:Glutamate dehydrogenase, NAD-specific, partial [Parasponia andersonii]